MDFLDSADRNPQFWEHQYAAIQQLVLDAAPTQAVWENLTTHALWPAAEKFQAVAFHQLLSRFDLGGDRWVGKFARGFPTSGILSQGGVCPSQTNPSIRRPTSNRF